MEILIYVGIFALVAGFFTGILLVVTRVQSSQTALLEVNNQLNFSLQTIQRLIRDSSHIEVDPGITVSNLVLRMSDPNKDKTEIRLNAGAIEVKEGDTGSWNPITTNNVLVDSLGFVKYVNYPGHDSVQIDLAISYNTTNPQQSVTRTLRSAIARVSAATFDSSLIPGGSSTYDVGQTSSKWRDGYFSGDVDVDGGLSVGDPDDQTKYLQFNTQGSGAPSAADCSSDTQRGRLYLDYSSSYRLWVCVGAARGWDYIDLK